MRYPTFIVVLFSMFASCAFASPFDTSGETFQADLYPSQGTAIIRLTQQLAEQVKQKTPNVDTIRVVGDRQSIRDALNHEFPNAKLVSDSAPVTFSVSVDTQDGKHGYVTVNVNAADISQTASAKFVEKPWADDWTLFRNANSKQRYLIATSPSPASSEAEALESAREVAVDHLYPIVRDTMRANAAMSRDVIKVSEDWIRRKLNYSVGNNPSKVLVPDTFVQRFERPYGDVWIASILIDASQPNIQRLNESYNRAAEIEFGKKVTRWSSVAGVAIVIGLLYAFVNAVTKGYFMWRLRALAIVGAIVLVLVAFSAA